MLSQPAPSAPIFHGDGFTLRPFALGEAAHYAALANQMIAMPDAYEHMLTFPRQFTRASARARIRQTHGWIRTHQGWSLAIDVGGTLAGQAQLICALPRKRMAEIAYWLHPQFQGRGLAHAAMARLLAEAAGYWPLEQVSATVAPGNSASATLLHRLGFYYIEQAEVTFHSAQPWRRLWLKKSANLLIYEKKLTA